MFQRKDTKLSAVAASHHSELHQLIQQAVTLHDDNNAAEGAIMLWRSLAVHLTAIIGEGGFNSLFSRSIVLARASYPWLPDAAAAPEAGFQFDQLKASFAGRDKAHTQGANLLLLKTYTHILASLIGEPLTLTLLRSAWLDITDMPGMESQNE